MSPKIIFWLKDLSVSGDVLSSSFYFVVTLPHRLFQPGKSVINDLKCSSYLHECNGFDAFTIV